MTEEPKISEPYSGIAEAYDYMLRHVDYDEWYRFITSVIEIYMEKAETVVELGCGTGKFGAKFSSDNYRIFGIDRSLNMLRVAKTRAFRNFRIICADIRNFALRGKIDFIFSVHDTMNYQLETSDVRSVFRSVKNIMHDQSIFLFDITTEHNIYRFFNNRTSYYTIRGMDVEWSNRYDEKKKHIISSFEIRNGRGETIQEEHVQRIYTRREIEKLLKQEGFEILNVCSDYTHEPPDDETVMINFIVRKRPEC